ncbi:MAG: DUF748 domain-containing protein, partial [Candidatus Omnitrophica bacterium]|nr:DUF748 domain-containing protein [Candidatus Omnitrophota bacterium]
MKILRVVPIVLLIVMIVAGVAAAILIPQLKPMLEKELSAALSSEVTVSAVRWLPMTGTRVDGFSARVPAAASAWLKVSSIEAQVALWSLLFRQGVVADVVVVQPEILVERLTSIDWNVPKFETLSGRPERKILPTRLVIRDGKAMYRDAFAQPPIGTWQLNDIQADVRLTSALAYRYTATASLQGPMDPAPGRVQVEGQTNLKEETEATVSISDLDVRQLNAYVKEAVGVDCSGGKLNTMVEVDGDPHLMTARV